MQLRNRCSLPIEKNPAQQFRSERGIPRPIKHHFVFLLDLVTWMRKALCKLPVICEKKQAFSLCVKTPYVEQPREFCRQQIENRVVDVRISPGRNESGGLVQHDGERRGDVNEFAIQLYVVACARLRAEVSAGFTVDSDPVSGDQLIALAT